MAGRNTGGRVTGAIVFLLGIAMLVFVFVLAHGFFTDENAGVQLPTPATEGPPTATLGTSALVVLVRVGLLLVMAIVGSLVAGRGIQLYFASESREQPRPE